MTVFELSGIQTGLSVIGAMVGLVVIAGGLYAAFRSSNQDARIKRLQDERDDYLSRLDYIEPKLVEITQQNELLRQLHNPTSRLETLEKQSTQNHAEIITLLNSQDEVLSDIQKHVHPGKGTS